VRQSWRSDDAGRELERAAHQVMGNVEPFRRRDTKTGQQLHPHRRKAGTPAASIDA
jgi:hypothetical protein